jgi:putative intracellular protease/amidase
MRRALLLLLPLLSAFANAQDARFADPKQTVVAILMFDGVQIIDYAAPYEVFAQAGFTIYTVSKDGKAVRSAQGLRSEVDHDFESAPRAAIVVVPGGHVHDVQRDAATLAWIRKQATNSDHVLSICTGSFILGTSGLLDGQTATTFHTALDSMQREFPRTKIVRDRRWVDNGKVVTSAGLASGIDTALHVVEEVRGRRVAESVALTLEYDWKPDTGFVRGVLADQHYRVPSTLQPPEGTRLQRVTSVGDRQTWESEFLVESALAPAELLTLFESQARRDPAFTVLPRKQPLELAWEYESVRGGRWRTTHVVEPGDRPNRYRVRARLAPAR